MAFRTGKQKFTKEEIIDILKRNVSLFKDEEEFVQYIVDLAMYLVEHKMQATEALERQQTSDEPVEKRKESYRRTRSRDEETYNALRRHSTRSDTKGHCRMCGAPMGKHITCPNCGNIG